MMVRPPLPVARSGHSRSHSRKPAPVATAADVKLACDQMKASTSLAELGELWGQIPRHVRAVSAVSAFKDAWKASLTPRPRPSL